MLTVLQGMGALVLPGLLQQVVGDEVHRVVGEQPLAHLFAPQAFLQVVEGQGPVPLPAEQFAIHHHAVRKAGQGLDDFGELGGDQVLPPGPDKHLVCPANHLGADAIPLPLRPPVTAGVGGEPVQLQGAG